MTDQDDERMVDRTESLMANIEFSGADDGQKNELLELINGHDQFEVYRRRRGNEDKYVVTAHSQPPAIDKVWEDRRR